VGDSSHMTGLTVTTNNLRLSNSLLDVWMARKDSRIRKNIF